MGQSAPGTFTISGPSAADRKPTTKTQRHQEILCVLVSWWLDLSQGFGNRVSPVYDGDGTAFGSVVHAVNVDAQRSENGGGEILHRDGMAGDFRGVFVGGPDDLAAL